MVDSTTVKRSIYSGPHPRKLSHCGGITINEGRGKFARAGFSHCSTSAGVKAGTICRSAWSGTDCGCVVTGTVRNRDSFESGPIQQESWRVGCCAVHNRRCPTAGAIAIPRSEEHTSELQSLMRISYAVFCLKKKKNITTH